PRVISRAPYGVWRINRQFPRGGINDALDETTLMAADPPEDGGQPFLRRSGDPLADRDGLVLCGFTATEAAGLKPETALRVHMPPRRARGQPLHPIYPLAVLGRFLSHVASTEHSKPGDRVGPRPRTTDDDNKRQGFSNKLLAIAKQPIPSSSRRGIS